MKSRLCLLGLGLLLLAGASLLDASTKVPISLSWDSDCAACTFNLYQGSHGKPACVGLTHPVPLVRGIASQSYVDDTPIAGQGPYSYAVTAVNADEQESSCSTEVQCTISKKTCVVR